MPPAVTADRTNLMSSVQGLHGIGPGLEGDLPGVAFAGGRGARSDVLRRDPAARGGRDRPRRRPRSRRTASSPRPWRRAGPAVVLLKASYDPRWTVTVDGLPGKPTMMAPSLVGVEVPAGRHEVRFRYKPYGHYPLLIVVGVLTLVALALVPRRAALSRRLARLGRRAAQRGAARETEVVAAATPQLRGELSLRSGFEQLGGRRRSRAAAAPPAGRGSSRAR